jgi:nucleoside-diphosphate-sugar epimerase
MKKKVLVVGGAGYIGGATVDELINEGHEVAVYDILVYETRYLKPVTFIYGDIRDTEKLQTVAKDYDVIVLMAALVGDPACQVNVKLTDEINYQAIRNFCKVIDPSKHIIFMSTCSVYGAQDGMLDETSPTNPLSSYASTKLAAEKYIEELRGTIFRLGTVYGLGDDYSRIRMDLVVNVLTMRAYYSQEITINGGEQWRPIISVVDIAKYIAESVKRDIRGTYVLSKENVIIRDLGLKIAAIVPDTRINYVEIPFQDARNYRVSAAKSDATFLHRPSVSVEAEVNRFLKLFRENRIANPLDQVYNNGAHIKNAQHVFVI